MALAVAAVATVAGVILTLLAGQEPGLLLGLFVIAGSLAAAFGVRRSAVYLLFPLPALALFVGALMTGVVHDSKLTSSTAGLGAGFTQWVAGIFFPMVIATILVLLVGGSRWLFGSQLVTGRGPLPAGLATAPGSTRPGPRPRRPGSGGQWAAEDPFGGGNPNRTRPAPQPGTGPQPGSAPPPARAPRPGRASGPGARGPRPPRDQRADRDPWGDPRLPGGRTQPPSGSHSQPPAGPRPRPGGPAGPASAPPSDRTGPHPQQGPSWDPAARPQRRPQPPEGWTPR